MRNAFIDFAALKEQVSFADAITLLGLTLKHAGNQWRGKCPSCEGSGERALVVTEGRGFYCWGQRKGGDQIALAAHVLELPAKEAAQELAKRAGLIEAGNSTGTSTSTVKRTVPESEGGDSSKLEPLSYLEADHEAVVAIGFDTEKAKTLGIGYAPRGMMRGTVAVPIRDENGILLGYIGIEEARLPPDFTTNVVALKRRA